MKHLFQKLMMLTAVASVAFLASCGEDEETLPVAPSLSVSAISGSGATVSNGGSIAATDSITFSFIANTPGGFNTLRATGSTSVEFSRTSINAEAGETAATIPNLIQQLMLVEQLRSYLHWLMTSRRQIL
jgi:hypothetical protein